MPSAFENPPADYKVWTGFILFLIVCVTIFLIVIYAHPAEIEQKPKPTPITLQGKLTPLTAEDMIGPGMVNKLQYRYVNPIHPYNEVYVFHPSSTLYQNFTVYAKEKINCADEVKFTALNVGAMVQSTVTSTYDSATDFESQLLLDTWSCVK